MPHSGPQTEALRRTEFEVLYGGARGGGKTDCGQAWLTRHIDKENYRFLVIRKNSDDLADWIDRAHKFYAPLGVQITGRPATIRFPCGAMGRTGHLKDDAAFTKYQGHEYHRILIEELTLIAKLSQYMNLIASCRSTDPRIIPQIFCTTNPGGPGHGWVKARFIDHGPYNRYVDELSGRSRIFIPAKVYDNPTLMESDPTYIKYLMSLDEKKRKAWLDGSWDIFEGQFFNEWDSNIHVCDPFPIPDHWKRYIGVDYGYSSPSAVVWVAVDEGGTSYLYKELYSTGLTFEALRDRILEMSEGENIERGFFDPDLRRISKGVGIYGHEVLNDQNAIPFIPAVNSRPNGWARVREYLRVRKDQSGDKYSWLKVFRHCKEFIRSFPSLVHDESKKEDLDTDSDDHLADALRYLLMGRPAPAEVQKKNVYSNLDARSKVFWKEYDSVYGSGANRPSSINEVHNL